MALYDGGFRNAINSNPMSLIVEQVLRMSSGRAHLRIFMTNRMRANIFISLKICVPLLVPVVHGGMIRRQDCTSHSPL